MTLKPLREINRYLRDNRVTSQTAAVFCATMQREIAMLIRYSNATASIDSNYGYKVNPKAMKEIEANLKVLGLPPGAIERLLGTISDECKSTRIEDEVTDEYLTESLRTVFAQKGMVTVDAFIQGIEQKYPLPEAA